MIKRIDLDRNKDRVLKIKEHFGKEAAAFDRLFFMLMPR